MPKLGSIVVFLLSCANVGFFVYAFWGDFSDDILLYVLFFAPAVFIGLTGLYWINFFSKKMGSEKQQSLIRVFGLFATLVGPWFWAVAFIIGSFAIPLYLSHLGGQY